MKNEKDIISRHFSKLGKKGGKKGGKARAEKYDAATLSKWARKGGRPRKSKAEKKGRP
jgi:hypothetical protein